MFRKFIMTCNLKALSVVDPIAECRQELCPWSHSLSLNSLNSQSMVALAGPNNVINE